ncbi:hypothetical protein D3C72_1402980 [compost metagenome]
MPEGGSFRPVRRDNRPQGYNLDQFLQQVLEALAPLGPLAVRNPRQIGRQGEAEPRRGQFALRQRRQQLQAEQGGPRAEQMGPQPGVLSGVQLVVRGQQDHL